MQTLQEVSGFIDVDRVHKDARPALMADLVSDEHSIIASAFGKSWTSLSLWSGRSLLFVPNSVSGSCVIDIHKEFCNQNESFYLHCCTRFQVQFHTQYSICPQWSQLVIVLMAAYALWLAHSSEAL